MSVRWNEQRKRWMVDVVFDHADGRQERVRKTAPVNTRRGAEEYERKLRNEIATGKRREVPTFDEFFPEFMERYSAVHNRPHENKLRRLVVKNHLGPALGRKKLDAITPRDVDAYKAAKLAAGLNPKTVNNHLALLSRVLGCAAEWEITGPPRKFKRLKVAAAPFDFLTFEEADRLIAAGGDWQTMITVAARTGLRQGELLALRWQDVDLVGRRLMVRRSAVNGDVAAPKNGKTREVPLSAEAHAALKSQRAVSAMRGELVWPHREGRLLTANDCWWPLIYACRRAGLREIGWHTLRHTFASHLVMRGASLKAVQELLGHASMEMTLRYAHLSPQARTDAVALLDGPGSYGNLTATDRQVREKTGR
jgi:integrase